MKLNTVHKSDQGKQHSRVHWRLTLRAKPQELEPLMRRRFGLLRTPWRKAIEQGWHIRRDAHEPGVLHFLPKPNLVVDSGVQASLDRLFAINGPPGAVVRLGVDNGAANPVAGTTQSGANTKTLLTFDSVPTRAGNTVTATRTFTNANVNFIMRRFFLSRHTADLTNSVTADTAGTLYSMTNVITIDFTSLTAWSLVVAATVLGAGT